ncbi:MAG: CheR family methyltransferase, partial [Terricaulis sp.]
FKELNLIGAWPMRGQFDVIFCRNVVIYFEEATQTLLWNRFKNMLAPQGRLYIGHSERIDVAGYESDGLTVYRLSSVQP